jgi:hypothetical protein
MKGNKDGKAIVNSLNFDTYTDPLADGSGCTAVSKFWSYSYGGSDAADRSGCYGLRPDQNWPFWSSPDLTNIPVPGGTTQSCDAGPATSTCTFATFNTTTPGNNKFAIKAVVNGGGGPPPPPPAQPGGTHFQGKWSGVVIH